LIDGGRVSARIRTSRRVPLGATPACIFHSVECVRSMPVSSNRRAEAAAHLQSGVKALTANAIPAARASLQAAVALEPSWAEPRYYLARVHFEAGDRVLAEQAVRAAREADPQHARPFTCLEPCSATARPSWRPAAIAPSGRARSRPRRISADLGVLQLFLRRHRGRRANLHARWTSTRTSRTSCPPWSA